MAAFVNASSPALFLTGGARVKAAARRSGAARSGPRGRACLETRDMAVYDPVANNKPAPADFAHRATSPPPASFGQARSPRSAVELWKEAERARSTAQRMSTFAAFSGNGAAFAQLQMNASLGKMWRVAEELEEAALLALETEHTALSRNTSTFGDDSNTYEVSYESGGGDDEAAQGSVGGADFLATSF
mmetsp:Transcript_12909/g.31154  ORF Transcript_12909/g.31154 Transcript_12909/m.31154 type:complete len:189 (-) Transcript_12909:412-978(-)|eukprot:CAMPEP_0197586210 /NCGR_PEP_ID=MMETSP1326-20131121/8253_1 /TAXON_ID=1155430 /ORGANISM="Genus nov. species nov., Strain RCC2288" /LENGTH=188 /DNA_ID=CAMNT_0043150807 /DNA_START=193 /DNA_END=759 /DNA_ORIENTATION=-